MPRYLIKVDSGKRLTRDQKDIIFGTIAECLRNTVGEALSWSVEDGDLDSTPDISIIDTETKIEERVCTGRITW